MLKPKRQLTHKKDGSPGWMWRRWVIFPLIAYACWRLAVMENAPDTRLNDTIAWGWQLLIMVLVLFYTGFATMQDIAAIWVTRSGRPYAAEQQPEPAEREEIPEPPAEPAGE
jgi:hypothetical protein